MSEEDKFIPINPLNILPTFGDGSKGLVMWGSWRSVEVSRARPCQYNLALISEIRVENPPFPGFVSDTVTVDAASVKNGAQRLGRVKPRLWCMKKNRGANFLTGQLGAP